MNLKNKELLFGLQLEDKSAEWAENHGMVAVAGSGVSTFHLHSGRREKAGSEKGQVVTPQSLLQLFFHQQGSPSLKFNALPQRVSPAEAKASNM